MKADQGLDDARVMGATGYLDDVALIGEPHVVAAGGGCEGAKHGVFSCTQQMGAKNAKHVESESVREQKMKRWW